MLNIALAIEQPSFEMNTNLQIINFINNNSVLVTPQNKCVQHTSKNTMKTCNTYKQEILQRSVQRGKLRIAQIFNKIDLYKKIKNVQENKDLLKSVFKIEKVLKCIQAKLPEIKFTCKRDSAYMCKENTAYVVLVPFSPFNKTVNLCPILFTNYFYDNQVGVIIHEVSHLCGVKDTVFMFDNGRRWGNFKFKADSSLTKKRFGRKVKKVRNKRTRIVSHNYAADYYEYWIAKGFCLPGFDCPLLTNDQSFKD